MCRYLLRIKLQRTVQLFALLIALAALWSCRDSRTPRDLPEIPRLKVEAFLPAVREQISEAVRLAHEQGEDAESSGRLGMVLHAYEQCQAAEVCYRRADA